MAPTPVPGITPRAQVRDFVVCDHAALDDHIILIYICPAVLFAVNRRPTQERNF